VTYYENNDKKYVKYPDGSADFFHKGQRDRHIDKDNVITVYDDDGLLRAKYEKYVGNSNFKDPDFMLHCYGFSKTPVSEPNTQGFNQKTFYEYKKDSDGKVSDVYVSVFSYHENGCVKKRYHNKHLIEKDSYGLNYQKRYNIYESIAYYDDENGRVERIDDKESSLIRKFYNNESNSLKEAMTSYALRQYAEDGKITLSIEDIGQIQEVRRYNDGSGKIRYVNGSRGYVSFFENGQLEERIVEGEYQEYYNNDSHSLKKEKRRNGLIFTYDEDGNKTTVFAKDELIFEDGKLKSNYAKIGEDEFLFNDKGDLLVHHDSSKNSYYFGNGEEFITYKKSGNEKYLRINAYGNKFFDRCVLTCGVNMDNGGLFIELTYSEASDATSWYVSRNLDFGLDGKILFSSENIITEYDKDGTYICKNKDGSVRSFGNPDKKIYGGNTYVNPSQNEYCVDLRNCELYITERTGLNMEGYIIENKTGNKQPYSYDEQGHFILGDKNGDRVEKNIYNKETRSYEDGNLVYERDATGKNEKWYVYTDNVLTEVTNKINGIINTRDIYDGKGRLCSFKYYMDPCFKGVVNEATYYNQENQTVNTQKHFAVDGGELSETKYKYYAAGDKIFSVTRKYNDGRVDFKHYDKDGNDDTIKYLAIKKVAQRQAEKGEKLRQETQKKGKSPEIMVTKKLNKVQKAIAMYKAKKEVAK